MAATWPFVVLLVYPALQVPMLWAVVRYFGLRNDDGPRNPVGYSLAGEDGDRPERGEWNPGRCDRCGTHNDPFAEYCKHCLSGLRGGEP